MHSEVTFMRFQSVLCMKDNNEICFRRGNFNYSALKFAAVARLIYDRHRFVICNLQHCCVNLIEL